MESNFRIFLCVYVFLLIKEASVWYNYKGTDNASHSQCVLKRFTVVQIRILLIRFMFDI